MDTPHLSLIVLSFRRFDATTGPCLGTLLAQLPAPRVELILVDNGSDDGAAGACSALAARHPALRYLPLPENRGFGGGMNAGVDAARGDWVLLVNSDTLFPPGALDALQRVLMEVPPQVALIGPVSNAAGNGQCLPLPGASLAQAVQVGEAAMRHPTCLLTPLYRTDFFCAAIRRPVWHALGGLDSAFGTGYYEDFDFSLRLRASGHEQLMAEDVFVVHAGSGVFSTLRPQQQALLKRNRALLQQRHPGVRFDHLRAGNADALRHLLAFAQTQGWTPALRARAAWRYAALQHEVPRSPFKRWHWHRACRGLREALDAAAISPEFPTVATAARHDPA